MRLGKLYCSLCGKKNEGDNLAIILSEGWYLEGISSDWKMVKRVLCPNCVESICGERVQLSFKNLYGKDKKPVSQLSFEACLEGRATPDETT